MAVKSTAALPAPQPDGSGGAGNFGDQFLAMITGRAAAWADGEIQRRFGGGLTETVTTDANGRVRPESQPGTPSAQVQLQALLKNPVTWVVAGAAVVIVGILIARR